MQFRILCHIAWVPAYFRSLIRRQVSTHATIPRLTQRSQHQMVPDSKPAARMRAETLLRMHEYELAWQAFDRVAELAAKVQPPARIDNTPTPYQRVVPGFSASGDA